LQIQYTRRRGFEVLNGHAPCLQRNRAMHRKHHQREGMCAHTANVVERARGLRRQPACCHTHGQSSG
jgi:hypothetical protein